jgi:DNA-binding NarL/FixJ family response regulator
MSTQPPASSTGGLTAASPLRVVVADDHPIVLDGWRLVLSLMPDVVLVGCAATGQQAVDLAASERADVVVMDLQMPGLDGFEATRRVLAARPDVAVLVVTQSEDDESIGAAMEAGARGYLLKGAGAPELMRALHAVAAGNLVMGAELGPRVRARLAAGRTRPDDAFPQLTAREREVLDLLAGGATDSQIASRLGTSVKTVRNHLGNLLPKIPAHSRTQAVRAALTAGLGGQERT